VGTREHEPGNAATAVEDEDAAVVRQCRKGDVDAFEVLVERYQEKMLTTAYRMLGDYDDACEVVQETFLSAYRSIRDFRSESRFSTWLFSIVMNHSRNRLKKRQARARREVLSLDDPDGPGECAGLHLPEESVLDRLDQNTRDEKVRECIGALDGEHREVLVLRDIEGCSYEEIANILELPGGTIRSRLFRARNALKNRLVKVFGERR
jgi:RNA polymerase sigma-70 factor (ECF subfamily)